MKHVGTFMTGLLIGAALFSGSAAYAAGITAEQSTNRFLVDGKEVQLTAYAILHGGAIVADPGCCSEIVFAPERTDPVNMWLLRQWTT